MEGGRTPYLDTAELAQLGFSVALFPASGFLAAAAALQTVYAHLKQGGIGTGAGTRLLPFAEMNTLMGFPAVHAFERRHGSTDARA